MRGVDRPWPWALWALLTVVAAGAGWWAWVALVAWLYRVRAQPAELLWAVASDGWRIAVHARPAAPRRFREPVLLCHGFAINRHTFDFDPPYSLAHALAEAGFECFTVEWRGTGASRRP